MPRIEKEVTIVITGKTDGEAQGKIIKLLRMWRGLTQKQLAEKVKMSRSTIQSWERGGVSNEGQKHAVAIALGVSPEFL